MISFQAEKKQEPITRTDLVLDTFYTWGPLNQHFVFNGKKENARGTIFNNFILEQKLWRS